MSLTISELLAINRTVHTIFQVCLFSANNRLLGLHN